MQQPTCKNTRIRSAQDAHHIFYAIQKGHLHMVTRRLDANERLALCAGCVYAWEERGPHSEVTGLGIERFTEGRRWSQSRVRDEFLFYYEKYTPHPDPNQLGLPLDPNPPRNWDPLVKQTYSVWVNTPKGRRKWHLTAYFTQSTVDNLGTIDDIPGIQDLVVPTGIFQSTRVNKGRPKSEEQSGRSKDASSKATLPLSYAPFFSLYNRYPSELASAPTLSDSVKMYEPYPTSNSNAYPTQGQYPTASTSSEDQPVFLRSISGPAQSPPNTYSNPVFSPPTQYQDPPNANNPYPSTSPVAISPSASTSTKTYQNHPVPTPSDYRPRLTHAASIPPFNSSTTQWSRQSAEPFNTHLSPRYDQPGSYFPIQDRILDPSHSHSDSGSSSSPSSSSISDTASRRRDSIPFSREDSFYSRPSTLEPSYELHSHHPPIPAERRGSIGPDRDLASIHALTRRHPYRRDPRDDKALRLLPP